jgi:hypothetical protein
MDFCASNLPPRGADRWCTLHRDAIQFVLMLSGRHGCEIAVLTVICVLMIFLFPLMHGPYSVLHGPVTALRAARAAVHLRLAIVQAALSSLANSLISALMVFAQFSFSKTELQSVILPECNTVFRC